MKILFLCGSLEPGRDGVGDYTRKLAVQLIRNGHSITAVAINDNYVKENLTEIQLCDGMNLPVLRLTSTSSLQLRLKQLNEKVKAFVPDWLSLQYVPYAFDKRGAPLYLGNYLNKLESNASWHVMIHEPFIAKQKSLKNKLMRALQMSSLRLIKRKLGPIVFHTSIPRYNQLLTEISVEARLLGLFGNITVPENCLPAKRTTGENKITGLYFGSAPAAQYHPLFAQKLKEFCEKNLLPLELIICGKSGVNGENFADEIAAACKGLHFEIVFLGELSPEALSDLFLKADFGIARIPPLFLGKSGSAISMLEHGLPLWVPLMGKDSISENLDFRPELCFHNLEDIKLMERRECISRLPHIADKFIQALN